MNSEWNPMENDYRDKQFNSYNHGPGISISGFNQDLQARSEFKLFVGNIPKLISEKAIENLFKRIGDVKKTYIVRKNENEKNFAFITYSKSEDASEAISRFNKFPFADSSCLHVALTKSRDQPSGYRDRASDMENTVNTMPSKPIIFDQSMLISKNEVEEGTAHSNSSAPKIMPKLLEYNKEFKYCMHCHSAAKLMCSQCENMFFCSEQCQKNIWPIHFQHCYPCLSTINDDFDIGFDTMSFEHQQTYEEFLKEVFINKTNYTIVVCRVTNNSFYGFREDRRLELMNLAEQLNSVFCGSRCSNTLNYNKGNLYVCKIKGNPLDLTDAHDDADSRITSCFSKEYRRVRFDSPDTDCIDNNPTGGRHPCLLFDIDSGARFNSKLDNLREFTREVEIPIAQAMHCIIYDDSSTSGTIRPGNMYSVQLMDYTKYVTIKDRPENK